MWNLNGGLRGPISSLDVASLLKSDHVAAISNDYLALPKARQDVLKVAKHEALPKLPRLVHTGCLFLLVHPKNDQYQYQYQALRKF